MNTLLKLQLKKVYGENFLLDTQDEKFQKFLDLVKAAYEDYEEAETLLEKILDVSSKELEKANDLLNKNKELLKSVENSMDDAVFYKDLNHKYIGCNKIFADFLCLSEKQIVGKTDYDFFDKNIASTYYNTNEEIIKNNTKSTYKQWVEYNGERTYVFTSKTPLINHNGEVIGIVGVSRDITSEYKLQTELESKNIMLIQQNKLISMGEMIANIAHQWRQPLNSVALLIQKMGIFYKKGLLDKEKIDENISQALYLMECMSETIDDFRNFFSPDKIIEDFHIDKLIDKSSIMIEPTLEKNNILLNLNIDKKYFVTGYKNEFFQVIINLLNNSIDALITDKIDTPKIEVTVINDNDNIIIDICDNAHGIDNSVINKIFEPYFTTKNTGTGLGLYMSKIIIEEHMEGEINVKSSYFGTTFTIILKGGTNLDYS